MSPPTAGSDTCVACGEPRAASARFREACGAGFGPRQATGCFCANPEPDTDGYCGICGLKAEGAVRFADFEEYVDAGLAMACDRGRGPGHPPNQDNGGVLRRSDGLSLMVVADGVSASDRPEAGSLAAVKSAKAAFLDLCAGEDEDALAKRCVTRAAEAVVALNATNAEDSPASTIIVGVARDRAFALAWVGDSRAYCVMPGVPETLLTRDDSWCLDQADAKRMTYEEALADANAHAITQWLGMDLATMTHPFPQDEPAARRCATVVQRRSMELRRCASEYGKRLHGGVEGCGCRNDMPTAGLLRQFGGRPGQDHGHASETLRLIPIPGKNDSMGISKSAAF